MVAAETDCNGIVPIALLILLIFLKLNQNLKFKPMEQYNLKNNHYSYFHSKKPKVHILK